MSFVKNAWYVVAWESEISDAPIARTILNEPLVIFPVRGGVAVLEDRCCHRSVPLSIGKLVEGGVQCAYHGLEFNGEGECIKVPGQSTIPPNASVLAYPVCVRYGWVWVWMGDPHKADPGNLPDWWWLESRDWKTIEGRGGKPMYLKANYLLVSDNLFDISHLTYVHSSSIGADSIIDFPPKTERWEDQKRVKMSRVIYDRPAAPFYQKAGNFQGNVDRWIMTTSDLPYYMASDAGSVEVGTGITPGGVEEGRGVEMKIMNLPTPETETTTHYFYSHCRHFKLDSPEWDEIYRTQFTQVFDEDCVVLEAQQRRMSETPDAIQVDINADAPNLQVRRMVDEMIAAEKAELPQGYKTF